MASYTELNLKQAKEILSLYGIQSPKELIPLGHGISNSNYRVVLDNHQPVILKISNDKDLEELQKEQQILLFLKQFNFALAVAPFLTTEGHAVYEWNNLHGVIYPVVAGEVPPINKNTCFQIGLALATLHQISREHQTFAHLRSHTEVGFGFSQLCEYVQQSDCPTDFKEAFDYIWPQHKVEELRKLELEKGIVHGDLYYDNTLFDHGELKAILDFEQSGVGEFMIDLGISISGTCLKEGRLSPKLIKAFIKGYQKVHKLDKREKKYLNDIILLGLFSISRWRIKRFIEKKLDKNKTENYKELLQIALNYNRSLS